MIARPSNLRLALPVAAATLWFSMTLAIGDGDAPTSEPQYLPISAKAEVGSEIILLEVARTPQERARGLMFRPALQDDRGMLFPADPLRPMRMWMKNVPVPLDLVFMYEGRVVALAEQVPPCLEASCPSYGPFRRAVDQVLELRAGRAAELGLKAGDPIRIEDITPSVKKADPLSWRRFEAFDTQGPCCPGPGAVAVVSLGRDPRARIPPYRRSPASRPGNRERQGPPPHRDPRFRLAPSGRRTGG
jgi:uncharacterized protein